MWFSNGIQFPYPVLTSDRDDFLAGRLDFSCSIAETIQTGEVEISFSIEVLEDQISRILDEGTASIGLFVVCPTTYYSKFQKVSLGSSVILLTAGELRGRVEIRPVIFTRDSSCKVPGSSIHSEFDNQDWKYGSHEFLAIGELQVINVGHEKLAPMETVFVLARDSSLEPGAVSLQLDSEKIGIVLNDDTFKKVHDLRSSSIGKTVLLNSLYLPAVVGLLDILNSGPGGFEERRWFQVLHAKFDHLGINLAPGSSFLNAQKLLQFPLQELVSIKEFTV